MADDVLLQALDSLVKRRDAIDEAITALRAVLPGSQPFGPELMAKAVDKALDGAVKKLTARSPKPSETPAPRPQGKPSSSYGETDKRDEAILHWLRTNNGVGTSKELRSAMPKEPLSAEQSDAAYRNTMTRLRTKGLVARTGDTWSLVSKGES